MSIQNAVSISSVYSAVEGDTHPMRDLLVDYSTASDGHLRTVPLHLAVDYRDTLTISKFTLFPSDITNLAPTLTLAQVIARWLHSKQAGHGYFQLGEPVAGADAYSTPATGW